MGHLCQLNGGAAEEHDAYVGRRARLRKLFQAVVARRVDLVHTQQGVNVMSYLISQVGMPNPTCPFLNRFFLFRFNLSISNRCGAKSGLPGGRWR